MPGIWQRPEAFGKDAPPKGWPSDLHWIDFKGPKRSRDIKKCTIVIKSILEGQGIDFSKYGPEKQDQEGEEDSTTGGNEEEDSFENIELNHPAEENEVDQPAEENELVQPDEENEEASGEESDEEEEINYSARRKHLFDTLQKFRNRTTKSGEALPTKDVNEVDSSDSEELPRKSNRAKVNVVDSSDSEGDNQYQNGRKTPSTLELRLSDSEGDNQYQNLPIGRKRPSPLELPRKSNRAKRPPKDNFGFVHY